MTDYNNIETYNYSLPDELIAQYPAPERSRSRLLAAQRDGEELKDMLFTDIADLLDENCFLVMNNTTVVPARMPASKTTGGKSELFFLEKTGDYHCKALLRGRFKPGDSINIGDISVTAVQRFDDGSWLISSPVQIRELMDTYGRIPLPPYIQRDADSNDAERYQTIYAKEGESVAAPTAGLHFTKELLKMLANKGVESITITLNVGIGTFRPVKTATLDEHEMHYENYTVTDFASQKINDLKASGKKLIAVGTTSVRTLESSAGEDGAIRSGTRNTNLFIHPGYKFKTVDGLITNFHLPKSSLLVLVSAFMGFDNCMNAYRYAVQEKYRFFSYGDAMIVL